MPLPYLLLPPSAVPSGVLLCVTIPTDNTVQILIRKGLLRELDMAHIPNINNIKPYLLGLYYDPENKYSVPYQWGVTGIAYNTQLCRHHQELECLLDLKRFGSMGGSLKRKSRGLAAPYLGYDYNDTNPNHHQEAIILLKEIEPCLAGYYVGSTLPNWVNKELLSPLLAT